MSALFAANFASALWQRGDRTDHTCTFFLEHCLHIKGDDKVVFHNQYANTSQHPCPEAETPAALSIVTRCAKLSEGNDLS